MGYELLENDLADSTLWAEGSDDARLLFITILSKANGSEVVRTPLPVLFVRTFPKDKEHAMERGMKALAELARPDPFSKSGEKDGRRVVEITDDHGRGLLLPSYRARRNRYQTAARMRRLRAGKDPDVTFRDATSRASRTERHPASQPESDAPLRPVTPRDEMFASEAEAEQRQSRDGTPDGVGGRDEPIDEIEAIPQTPVPVEATVTYLDLQRVWNENRGHLPEWVGNTAARIKSAKARLREHPDLAFWTQLVIALANCDWTNGTSPGKSHGDWVANPDFLLRPSTPVKFREGDFTRNARFATQPPSGAPKTPENVPEPESPDDRSPESHESEIADWTIVEARARQRDLMIKKLEQIAQDAAAEQNKPLLERVKRQLVELNEAQKADLALVAAQKPAEVEALEGPPE